MVEGEGGGQDGGALEGVGELGVAEDGGGETEQMVGVVGDDLKQDAEEGEKVGDRSWEMGVCDT